MIIKVGELEPLGPIGVYAYGNEGSPVWQRSKQNLLRC